MRSLMAWIINVQNYLYVICILLLTIEIRLLMAVPKTFSLKSTAIVQRDSVITVLNVLQT
jgi:hypothetical protein